MDVLKKIAWKILFLVIWIQPHFVPGFAGHSAGGYESNYNNSYRY